MGIVRGGEERTKENGRIRNKEKGRGSIWMFKKKEGSGELQEIICGM
jgi:hypothetical protein